MASSLRRSGRGRQAPSEERGAAVVESTSASASAMPDEVETGRPKRKRASSTATASPENASTLPTSTADSSSPGLEQESPMRSRSGRRIVVKGGSQGRYNKALRASSERVSPVQADEDGGHEEEEENNEAEDNDDGEDDADAEGEAEDEDGSDYAEGSNAPHTNGAPHRSASASTSPTTRVRLAKVAAVKREESETADSKGQFDLKVESDAEDEEEGDGQGIATLLLADEDKAKLSVVINAFAPDLLRLRIAPGKQSSPQNGDGHLSTGLGISSITANGLTKRTSGAERRAARSETLDDLLVMPELPLQRLRSHFAQLQAPLLTSDALRAHLTGSHVAPSRDGIEPLRSRLKTVSTCIALVDEIARRYRMEGKTPVVGNSLKPKDGNEYALQMRLPTGDYFTNAVWLTQEDATALDTGHAHLVNIALASTAPKEVDTSVPSLGERLYGESSSRLRKQQASVVVPPPQVREKRYEGEDFAKPVTHLYYGPWASFAPTYDSFDGQLSYKASCALWRAKRDGRGVLERWAKEEADPERADLETELEGLGDEDIDVEAILQAYDALPAAERNDKPKAVDIVQVLQYNAGLLRQLHDLQEIRWRRYVALDTKAMEAGEDAELEMPSSAEHAVAHQLMDSLTSLLATRPRHGDRSIVPTDVQLQAAASSAAVDPALLDGRAEAGMWGSLGHDVDIGADFAAPAASGQAAVPMRRPAAFTDNETIKMSGEAEERAALHLASLHAPPVRTSSAAPGSAPRYGQAPAGARPAAHGPPQGPGGRPPLAQQPRHHQQSPAHQQGSRLAQQQQHSAGRPLPHHGQPHMHPHHPHRMQPQQQHTPRHPHHQQPVGSQVPFARPPHPSLGVSAGAPPSTRT